MHIQYLISFGTNTELHTFDVATYDDLKTELRKALQVEHFTIIYFDDEGDCVKLTCQPEFDEAINFASSNGNFLSIIVEKMESEPKQSIPSIPVEEPKQPQIPNPVNSLFELLSGKNSPMQAVVNNLVEGSGDFFANLNAENFENASQNIQNLVRNVVEPKSEPEPEIIEEEIEQEEEHVLEVEEKVVHHAICDNCNQTIVGIRYKCIQCPDFDFCEACEGPEANHDASHVFAKIYRRDQYIPRRFGNRGKCGRRGGRGMGGGRKRLEKLENSVSELQQQIAALLAKKNEVPVPEPVVEEPIDVPEPIVQEPIVEEPQDDDSVRIEDVDESEEEEDVEVIPAISEQTQKILNDLNQMGFTNNELNMRLVTAYNGDIEAVLENLLTY